MKSTPGLESRLVNPSKKFCLKPSYAIQKDEVYKA
jgi:hypothetical protein